MDLHCVPGTILMFLVQWILALFIFSKTCFEPSDRRGVQQSFKSFKISNKEVPTGLFCFTIAMFSPVSNVIQCGRRKNCWLYIIIKCWYFPIDQLIKTLHRPLSIRLEIHSDRTTLGQLLLIQVVIWHIFMLIELLNWLLVDFCGSM